MSKHYTDEDVKRVIEAWKSRNICQHERDREPDKEFPVWVCEDCDSRAVLDAVAPAIAARALREAAERTVDRAVCCDEYEQFKATGNRPKHPHHICYWGASHAEALRSDADEIEAGR